MAVVVQCYHCSTILELDEGFRGGVCRCSTCGSLLQVPKASTTGTPKARPAAPGAAITEVKRPVDPNADPGLSRGQFDARQQSGGRTAVSDMGGSSSGLRQGRPSAPTATKVERLKALSGPSQAIPHAREVHKNRMLLWIGIGLGALVFVAVIAVLFKFVFNNHEPSSSRGGGTTVVQSAGGGHNEPIPTLKGPQFLGVPLVGKQIVLSIDSASSMQDCFDFLRRACYQAMDTLEPDQTLVVVLWSDPGIKKVPASGYVGKTSAAKLRDELELVPVHGSSDAAACMKATFDIGGDQVIFVTAKPGLSEDLAATVLAARKNGQRLDGVKINSEDNPSPLESLARQSGGKYVFVTQRQLERAIAPPTK
jgi:hypothetical protein